MGLAQALANETGNSSQAQPEQSTLSTIESFGNRVAGDVVGAAEKVPVLGTVVHDTGHILSNLAQWDRDAYNYSIARPLGTFELAGVNANNWGDYFKGSTWSKSWNETQYTSVGQAFAGEMELAGAGFHGNDAERQEAANLQHTFSDPNLVQAAYKNGSAASRVLSGSIDATVNWAGDPLNTVAAGAGKFRALSHGTQDIKTSQDAIKAINRPPVQKMLDGTDTMTAYQAKKLPFIAKSANPDLLASVFNQTVDRGIRENAYRYMVSNGQDELSKQALMDAANSGADQVGLKAFVKGWGSTADQAAGIMESIANAQVPYNPLVTLAHLEANGRPELLAQARHAAADDAERNINMPGTQKRMLQDILDMNGHITWQPGRYDVPISAMRSAFKGADKFGDASKLAAHLPGGDTLPGRFVSQVLYKGLYQTPLKVLRAFGDNWPDGWLDFTNAKSSDTLEGFLNRARGLEPGVKQGYINQYLEAGSDVGRKQAVVQQAEHTAAKATLMARGFSDGDAEAILAGTYKKRTDAILFGSQREAKRPGSQAFSAATYGADKAPVDVIQPSAEESDQIKVHGFSDDDGVPYHSPILETMKRQGTPLLHLDEIDKWARNNIGKFQTLKRAGQTVEDMATNSADMFSSIWKNGVLLRLGFTPRVMTDMGLRSVSTLGAVNTLSLGKEAASVVLHNMGVSSKDYLNKMLKNRLFDPDTIKNLDDEAGKLSSARDAARIDYLYAMMQKGANDENVKAFLTPIEGTPTDEKIASLKSRFDDLDTQLAEARKNANGYKKVRFGDGKLKYKGVQLTDIFGAENATWLSQQVSSAHMIGKTFQRNADMEDGLSGSGSWDTIRATSQNDQEAASHLKAWRHSINNQIMGDTLGSQVVRNNWSPEDIVKWLKTPQGKSYMKNIPGNFNRDYQDYAERVAAHVHYTVPAPVRAELSKTGVQGLSAKKLEQLIPSPGDRPDVNGQLLSLNMARSKGFITGLQSIQHGLHQILGQMPLDTFVYHPTAAGFYRAHLADSIDKYISFHGLEDATSLSWDHATRQGLEQQAFAQAKNDVWSIMYDMTQQSTAAHQLRFLFPFMNAQQEIIRHWFNIALDHPQILQRQQQIWNSPARAGVVYDTTTGDQADNNTPLDNQAIRFQIPHGISSLLGLGTVQDLGQMQISKASINPILQGQHWYIPGAGPMVQIPVQAMSQLNPGLMDNKLLKTIMPYGPGDNLSAAILPTFAQRLEQGFNVNDPQYSTTFAKVYQTETIRYNEGQRTTAPSMQEIQARTQQLLLMQALGSAVLPFSAKFNPGTQTGTQKPRAAVTSGIETSSAPDLSKVPIQTLIDQYKKLESVDPANAATNFYNKYGQALFALTMSTSKSNASVPATAAGLAAISNPEIRAMIQADPSVAYAIVGPQAASGPFDMAAYNAEMNTEIGGGDTQTFRQKLDPADMIKEQQAQLGWQQYDQLTSLLNAKMAERGITSLNDSGAQDLKTLKDQFIYNMNNPGSNDYNPDWYTQYTGSSTDWNARIQSLTALVSDPNLANNPARTDLKSLGSYLEARQELNQELAARPNKEGLPTTLAAKSNADLAAQWDSVVSGLVMGNTNFALLYQHLLAGDPLNTNLKSNEAFQQSLVVGQ